MSAMHESVRNASCTGDTTTTGGVLMTGLLLLATGAGATRSAPEDDLVGTPISRPALFALHHVTSHPHVSVHTHL